MPSQPRVALEEEHYGRPTLRFHLSLKPADKFNRCKRKEPRAKRNVGVRLDS